MTRQGQDIGQDGVGYQAGGDITVNQGISPHQMVELMDAMTAKLNQHLVAANDLITKRCNEFRDAVVEKFSDPSSEASQEAFGDPDFTAALGQAQRGFARKGSLDLKAELVELVAKRSQKITGSRVANLIDQGIETAEKISPEEYAILAASFLIRYVNISGMNSAGTMARLDGMLSPFISTMPETRNAVDYLTSLGCATVVSFSNVNLWSALNERYGHLFASPLPNEKVNFPTGPILQTPPRLVFESPEGWRLMNNETMSRSAMQAVGFPADQIDRFIGPFIVARKPDEQIKAEVEQGYPSLRALSAAWDRTGLNNVELTLLGKLMAHSAVTARAGFDAALDIWVS